MKDMDSVLEARDVDHSVRVPFVTYPDLLNTLADATHRPEVVRLQAPLYAVKLVADLCRAESGKVRMTSTLSPQNATSFMMVGDYIRVDISVDTRSVVANANQASTLVVTTAQHGGTT